MREGEVGIYHCVSRCVRRAFLCGDDPLTGKSFEHRKRWIRQRLEELAGIFGIDVCGYALMSNHLHVVLRTRPDVAAAWPDEEVAQRWWRLFPRRRDEDGQPAEPQPHELAMLVADVQVAAERRRRLGSLSWFMRCLCEPIARRANKEDDCTGRFWEGRFKSQALLDDAAVLACNVYVELNPIRAAVADRPEQSQFTSAYDRIRARKDRAKANQKARGPRRTARPARRRHAVSDAGRDAWLCPIARDRPASKRPERGEVQGIGAPSARPRSARRVSSQSFLPMSLEDYLQLLDWTGRQLRRAKRGSIPDHLAPILDRLRIDGTSWVQSVQNFGRWFHRAAGSADHLAEEAARAGRHWLQGLRRSRLAFG